MKRIIPLLLVVIFCVSPTNTYGQVTEFPYTEGFDNETFVQGTDVYFITNWLGNYVDGVRIFQEESNVRSGVGGNSRTGAPTLLMNASNLGSTRRRFQVVCPCA